MKDIAAVEWLPLDTTFDNQPNVQLDCRPNACSYTNWLVRYNSFYAGVSLAFDGALLNRPSAGEPKIADALLLLYYGVYASPVLEPVVSPNNDGVAEKQGLAYRVVRTSTVTATLIGPDRVPRPVDSGQRGPGVYRFVWPATRPDGTTEPEGGWRFNVTAVDDKGQTSVADRLFSLNLTLGALAASPDVLPLGAGMLRATYTLAHPAHVNARIETATGVA